jgi:hypothetical protein
VPDPLLDRQRKRQRGADSNRRAAAKALGVIQTRDLCKGVDILTGKQCTRRQQGGCRVDGSPRCTTCYKDAIGDRAYKEVLRERHNALGSQCVGTKKNGMACKSRVCEQLGILAALRRTGTTSSGAREAMKKEASIQRIVFQYDNSRLCLRCFKSTYTGLGKELKSLTTCDADDDSCHRVAVHNGLCAHHHGLTLPASKALCAGEHGDFSCESGQPRMRSKGNLCKTCFDAMTTRMIAECPAARTPKRKRGE